MALKPLPSPEDMCRLLRYDPSTGELFWKARGPEWFISERLMKSWNTQWVGKRAGGIRGDGYLHLRVNQRPIAVHRVVWAMMHKAWPELYIDHINGDPLDNRACNLRQVTSSQNNRNRRASTRNKSGAVGVFWNRRRRSWSAFIRHAGKQINLGNYRSFLHAKAVRCEAQKLLGYSQRHGEFSIGTPCLT